MKMTEVIILIIVIGAMITLWTCACEHIWIFDPEFYRKRGYEKDIEELRKEIRELKDQINDVGFFNKED